MLPLFEWSNYVVLEDLSCHSCFSDFCPTRLAWMSFVDTGDFKSKGKFLCTSFSRWTDYIYKIKLAVCKWKLWLTVYFLNLSQCRDWAICATLCWAWWSWIFTTCYKGWNSGITIFLLLCYLHWGFLKRLSIEGWLFELDIILWLRIFSKVLFCIKLSSSWCIWYLPIIYFINKSWCFLIVK